MATLRRFSWLLGLVLVAALLIGITETLARTPAKTQRLSTQEILERVPDEPEILINLGFRDIPATSDLVKLGSRATPALVNCLVNNLDARARMSCAHVLVATRDQRAIDPLIAALDDPDRSVQGYALSALGQIESRKATPYLLELIDRPYLSGYARRDAFRAIGRSGDPQAIEPLLTRFSEVWEHDAQLALWDMRRQLSPQQLQQLIIAPLLGSPEDVPSNVIAFSIERAGDLALTDAVEPLQGWYITSNFHTRNRILYNLGRIGDASAIPFVESKLDPTGEARLLNNVIFALDRLGFDVAPLLRDAIANTRAYIRYNAAFVIGDIQLKTLLPELTRALEDINDIVRSQAALALGKIADPQTVSNLEKATRVDNPLIRRDALLALLEIDYAKHRDAALLELQETPHSGSREELLFALGRPSQTDIVSELILTLDPANYSERRLGLSYLDRFEALSNPDALAFLVRAASENDHRAFVLLARFADPRTTFLLEQWLSHPRGEVEQIMRALARMQSDAEKDTARRYFEKDGSMEQLYAAFYFAALGDTDGIRVLLSALELAPVEYKRAVAIILTELDYTALDGAQDTLVDLLQHPDAYVRLYAARPLAHRGIQAGLDQIASELDKKIPFLRDEALDILDRLPPRVRTPAIEALRSQDDPMLDRELAALLEKS